MRKARLPKGDNFAPSLKTNRIDQLIENPKNSLDADILQLAKERRYSTHSIAWQVEYMREQGSKISLSTAYRKLNRLQKYGEDGLRDRRIKVDETQMKNFTARLPMRRYSVREFQSLLKTKINSNVCVQHASNLMEKYGIKCKHAKDVRK